MTSKVLNTKQAPQGGVLIEGLSPRSQRFNPDKKPTATLTASVANCCCRHELHYQTSLW
mgnify:CR=1 FL=1